MFLLLLLLLRMCHLAFCICVCVCVCVCVCGARVFFNMCEDAGIVLLQLFMLALVVMMEVVLAPAVLVLFRS